VGFGPGDLVMSPGTVGNPTPEVMAEACAAAGLAGVSIWGTYVADGTSPAELGARLRAAGVPVFTLEAAVSWCDGTADGPERGAGAAAAGEAEFMTDLGAAIGAEGLFAVSMEPGELDLGRAIDGFGALCDRAAARGLWVAIEFLPWSSIPNLTTARAIVEGAARDNGGLVLDAWHFTRSGSRLADVAEVAGLVRDFQICDTAPSAETDLLDECMHRRLLPGEGGADVIGLVRALDEGGARCPVAIEVFSDELERLGPIEATVRAADATREILANARTGKGE
jgi:sugar phosphate isomerase/epimerase